MQLTCLIHATQVDRFTQVTLHDSMHDVAYMLGESFLTEPLSTLKGLSQALNSTMREL